VAKKDTVFFLNIIVHFYNGVKPLLYFTRPRARKNAKNKNQEVGFWAKCTKSIVFFKKMGYNTMERGDFYCQGEQKPWIWR